MTTWLSMRASEAEQAGMLRIEDGNHGEYRPRPDEFVSDGVAYIRAADMANGDINFARAGKINDAARLRIRKGIGRPRDVLLSHKGTVGRVGIAPDSAPEYVCSPQTTFWRALDPTRLDYRYLKHFFCSPQFVSRLDSRKNSSDMAPYVSLTEQRRLLLTIPPIEVQQEICDILGSIDGKITANGKLIETADSLAKAKFSHMMADSEAMPLTDVARFVNGKAFTKDASGTGRVVVRIAELNSGLGGSTVYNDIEVADQHLARPGDLLFAWSGSLTLHRWFRPEAIVNQHIFKVIPQRGFPIWCAYGLISRKLDEFKAVAADKATTMGHIQRRHLEELVDVPTRAVMESNDDEMTTLWNRALLAEQESLTLGSLRDALLPELMAGRIRVKDAEMTVEEVL